MKDPSRSDEGRSGADAVFVMPGHLLRRCHQISVAIFLDECARFDLTPPQFVTLAALARNGPLEQVSLGGVTALDRTTTVVVVKNLEERGLVTRRPSPRDRRSKLVAVTGAGLEVLEAAQPSVAAAQDRIIAPLTDRERELFVRLLDKIASANNRFSRAPRRVSQTPR